MLKIQECLIYFTLRNKVTSARCIIQTSNFINILLCQWDCHFVHLKCGIFFVEGAAISEAYSRIYKSSILALVFNANLILIFSIRKKYNCETFFFLLWQHNELAKCFSFPYIMLFSYSIKLCWLLHDQKQKLKLLELLLMWTYV